MRIINNFKFIAHNRYIASSLELMTLIILAEDGVMAQNAVCAMKLKVAVGPDTFFGGSPSLFRYGATYERPIRNSTACDLG
jgi:hypothetical protein